MSNLVGEGDFWDVLGNKPVEVFEGDDSRVEAHLSAKELSWYGVLLHGKPVLVAETTTARWQ